MNWLNKLRDEWGIKKKAPTTRARLQLDSVEQRDMPAVGLLQGFSFLDQNNNGMNDAGEPKNVGATISLRDHSGTVVASTKTDSEGYYRFNTLKAGTYTVEQQGVAGQVSSGVQNNTLITGTTVTGANSARVVIPAADPANLKLNRVPGAAGNVAGVNTAFTLAGGPFNSFTKAANTVGATQFDLFLTSGTSNAKLGSNFVGFCVDLFHSNPDSFKVETSLTPVVPPVSGLQPTSPENVGRLGYLMNNFGSKVLTTGAQQAGMALAVYELLYDSKVNLTAGNFKTLPGTDASAINEANRFLNLSAGKDQSAVYFNVKNAPLGTSGSQGMVSTELVNFANKNMVPPVPPTPTGKIDIEKFVREVGTSTTGYGADADVGPGPSIAVGDCVEFTFVVTNTGTSPLKNVNVIDNNATPSKASDDFSPNPVLVKGFNVGDGNKNCVLDVGEKWIYTSVQRVDVAGLQTNIGVVTANIVGTNTTVTDSDPANYTGIVPPCDNNTGSNSKGSKSKGSSGKGSSGKGSSGKGSSDKGSKDKCDVKGSSGKGSSGKGSSGKGSSDKGSKDKCDVKGSSGKGSSGKGSSGKGSSSKGSKDKCDVKGSSGKGSSGKGSAGKGSSSKGSKDKCDVKGSSSKASKSKGSSSKGSKSKGSSSKGSKSKDLLKNLYGICK